jgi:transcriptional regulator with XRE-family HTH domain
MNKIAAKAGLSRQFLCNILQGRRGCPPDVAQMLVSIAKDFGYSTSVFDWLFPASSANPLFERYKK